MESVWQYDMLSSKQGSTTGGQYLDGASQGASEGAVRGDRDAKLLALVNPPTDQLLPVVPREGSIVGDAGCTQQHISH